MAFIEARLDDCVAYGFTVTPGYFTGITLLDSGKEARNINWTKAKRKASALYQNFKPEEFAILLACFHACAGSGYSFRFKDHTDFKVTLGALGTTPGANMTPIQLVKVYQFPDSAQTRTRTITKPVAGTVTVYQNGVAKPGTIDTTTGLFTPTTNWTLGATLTGSFEFDVPMRFESDEMPSSYDEANAINTTVTLIEDFL